MLLMYPTVSRLVGTFTPDCPELLRSNENIFDRRIIYDWGKFVKGV